MAFGEREGKKSVAGKKIEVTVGRQSKTPLQAMGYQSCNAAEQRGILTLAAVANMLSKVLGSLSAGIKENG